MNLVGFRFIVSGRVQGVWFRSSTKKMAISLGIRGDVRNLSDGRVEVRAFGELPHIDRLRKWLAKGPLFAKVSQLNVFEIPYENAKTFDIRD